jgi:hypothetical protein
LTSLLSVALGGVIISLALKDGRYTEATAAAVAGVSVFAGIYAAAQALERLLEPLSHWFLSTEGEESTYSSAGSEADAAVAAWMAKPSDETKAAAETEMAAMAAAKAKIDEKKDDRAAAFWAIATVSGMLVSGFLHLYLLKLIGVSTTHGWDVFATGLVIGSGTKPLHDLITKISSKSEDSATSGSTTTTATS